MITLSTHLPSIVFLVSDQPLSSLPFSVIILFLLLFIILFLLLYNNAFACPHFHTFVKLHNAPSIRITSPVFPFLVKPATFSFRTVGPHHSCNWNVVTLFLNLNLASSNSPPLLRKPPTESTIRSIDSCKVFFMFTLPFFAFFVCLRFTHLLTSTPFLFAFSHSLVIGPVKVASPALRPVQQQAQAAAPAPAPAAAAAPAPAAAKPAQKHYIQAKCESRVLCLLKHC